MAHRLALVLGCVAAATVAVAAIAVTGLAPDPRGAPAPSFADVADNIAPDPTMPASSGTTTQIDTVYVMPAATPKTVRVVRHAPAATAPAAPVQRIVRIVKSGGESGEGSEGGEGGD